MNLRPKVCRINPQRHLDPQATSHQIFQLLGVEVVRVLFEMQNLGIRVGIAGWNRIVSGVWSQVHEGLHDSTDREDFGRWPESLEFVLWAVMLLLLTKLAFAKHRALERLTGAM